VVGAGLSGLAAARRFAASGVDTLVLEAQDRVGGRTLTHHRVHRSRRAVVSPSQLLNGERTTSDSAKGGRTDVLRRGARTVTDMALRLPADAPWTGDEAAAWDALTFRGWLADDVDGDAGPALANALVGVFGGWGWTPDGRRRVGGGSTSEGAPSPGWWVPPSWRGASAGMPRQAGRGEAVVAP
jgi:hypothetical protein